MVRNGNTLSADMFGIKFHVLVEIEMFIDI
jgi:hypothetical protein